MKVEELLKPRYEVIERYPNMDEDNLIVGTIIEFELFDEQTKQWYNHNERSNTYDAFYDCFPNIFKKLNWWEKRNLEDLPKYFIGKHRGDGVYTKTDAWIMGELYPIAIVEGVTFYAPYSSNRRRIFN